MKYLACILSILFVNSIHAQKRALKIEDADKWNSMREIQISNKANFVKYVLHPQDGDDRLVIHNLKNNKTDTFDNANNCNFIGDENYIAFRIKPSKQLVKDLKLKKTKKDKMPKDSLCIVSLKKDTTWKISQLISYQISENNSNWIAYLHQTEKTVVDADSTKKDSTNGGKDVFFDKVKISKERKKELEKAGNLVIQNLSKLNKIEQSSNFFIYPNVNNYELAADGKSVFFTSLGDSVFNEGIYRLDLISTTLETLYDGAYDIAQFKMDSLSNSLALIANLDTLKSKKEDKKHYTLYYHDTKNKFKAVADSIILNKKHWVNQHASISYSKNGKRIFFEVQDKPKHWPKDTTILAEEKVHVDIWSHHDNRLQPEQLKELSKDKKSGYKSYYDISKQKINILENKNINRATIAQDGNSNWAIAFDISPYEKSQSWAYPWAKDVYLIDLKKNNSELFIKNFKGYINFSPNGKYLYWYSQTDSNWFSYSIQKGKTHNLTAGINTAFYDDLDDHPALPYTHGQAGWLANDEALLLYDAYDIWMIDPELKKEAKKLTNGRATNDKFRIIKTDSENKFYQKDEDLLVKRFNKLSKQEAFDLLNISSGSYKAGPVDDVSLSFIQKSKAANFMLTRKGSSNQYPELYISKFNNVNTKDWKRISLVNPQQSQFKWYTTELINYISADGIPLQGVLYKPENFDPNKKYPMIVYFYEQLSDYINYYQSPRPSASTVSRSFYCSNDYFVFVPDIVYQDGEPGQSAFNCIMPGVLKLIEERSYINKDKLALQGQSWGGYQTAYLITKTNLFAASMAGAPVSNMTSAYGGIRWGSGMSRAFQYERGQSRIGGSLWDKPFNYIENSPVFYAHKVKTPLLIMHNDNDGAVPWYQGIEYFNALRRLDKEVWMLVYNGEEHNLMKRHNRVDLSIRMFGFFNYWLKDQEMPNWMKNGLPAIEKGEHLGY